MGKHFLISLIIIGFSASNALAQFDSEENSSIVGSDQSDIEVEALYDRFEEDEVSRNQPQKPITREEARPLTTLGDLGELEPFDDIAVIQRRFLPKTKRFEITGSLLNSLNNAFFNNIGGTVRLGYYFVEKLGVEAMYFHLSDTEKDITANLQKKRNINTRSLVVPESFMGASVKWSPIYGKMALFDEKIVPFDIYFAPGVGLTKTAAGGSEMTLHLGTGQIFA